MHPCEYEEGQSPIVYWEVRFFGGANKSARARTKPGSTVPPSSVSASCNVLTSLVDVNTRTLWLKRFLLVVQPYFDDIRLAASLPKEDLRRLVSEQHCETVPPHRTQTILSLYPYYLL